MLSVSILQYFGSLLRPHSTHFVEKNGDIIHRMYAPLMFSQGLLWKRTAIQEHIPLLKSTLFHKSLLVAALKRKPTFYQENRLKYPQVRNLGLKSALNSPPVV